MLQIKFVHSLLHITEDVSSGYWGHSYQFRNLCLQDHKYSALPILEVLIKDTAGQSVPVAVHVGAGQRAL